MRQVGLLASLRHLIDVLIEGYATVNRRLWVVAVPIGLDLFLWLGPRVSPRALYEAIVLYLSPATLDNPAQVQTVVLLEEWADRANLADLLGAGLIPTLVPRLRATGLPLYGPLSWAPPNLLAVMGVAAGMLLLGFLLWCLYLIPVADLVRGSHEGGREMLRRVGPTWWRLTRLVGLFLLVGVLFLLPAGFLTTLLAQISPLLANLVLYTGLAFLVWVVIYLYFAPQAVLLSAVQPLRAIYYSMQIVRVGFWSSLGFVVLSNMVRSGTVLIWQRFSATPVGLIVAIVLNGYIVSGLVTAALIYYREHLRKWLVEAG